MNRLSGISLFKILNAIIPASVIIVLAGIFYILLFIQLFVFVGILGRI